MSHEIAGSNQDCHADEQCGDIEQDDPNPVDLYWYRTDIVGSRIKFDESCEFLHSDEPESYKIANDESAPNDEGGQPQKRVSDKPVAGTESLENAYHACTLKDDDEQAGDDGHSGYGHHQRQDDPYIHVEKIKPCKYLGGDLTNGLSGVGGTIVVNCAVHLFDHLVFGQ